MIRTKNDNKRAVARIVLVEARNLPILRSKPYNVYCSLQMKRQRERSSFVSVDRNPIIWKDVFEFNLHEEFQDPLTLKVKYQNPLHKKDGFTHNDEIGKVTIELGALEHEKTIEMFKPLDGCEGGKLHLFVTISGTDKENLSNPNDIENWDILKSNLLKQGTHSRLSLKNKYVGKLVVLVHKAEGLPALEKLGGKSDPFCVVKLGHDVRRTQTVYKNLEPTWNKYFEFDVIDVCKCVEISIFDEENDKKHRFMGHLKIPLLHIHANDKKWFQLKDKELRNHAKGDGPKVYLELCFAYNKGRIPGLINITH